MIAEENPRSDASDAAVQERQELVRTCARSVMAELACGRHVDPLRAAWAESALQGLGKHKPKPDMAILRRLYEFGGLLVYRVAYFDPVTFTVTDRRVTFSEEVAKEELERLKRAGFTAGMGSFIVKFDGAFQKP